VFDLSTQKSVVVRDAGIIPALQPLIDYVRRNGEQEKRDLHYRSFVRNRLVKWSFVQYRVFMKNEEILNLLPKIHVAEVKKIADLCT
jgi:hypothetical protein